jgi:hypothetical protein
MLWESGSSSCTEHNKIGFSFSEFFYDLLWILQGAAKTHKEVKIHFARGSLERFELHKTALGFNTQDPTRMRLRHRGPGGAWELAVGEGSPELAHKRHWTVIELTTE